MTPADLIIAIDKFNRLVYAADIRTYYSLDREGPEALYDALMADDYPTLARELKEAAKVLGYFQNKPVIV